MNLGDYYNTHDFYLGIGKPLHDWVVGLGLPDWIPLSWGCSGCNSPAGCLRGWFLAIFNGSSPLRVERLEL